MEQSIQLYRKRYIPNECILLKDDCILKVENNLIITRWNTLKPRKDISFGYSAYFIDKGFKISKMYNEQKELVYWYCDIIDTHYDAKTNTYIFQDLLADVVIYPDNSIKVLDLDEVADLLEKEIIHSDTACKALHILNDLLELIYNGQFVSFQKVIEDIE